MFPFVILAKQHDAELAEQAQIPWYYRANKSDPVTLLNIMFPEEKRVEDRVLHSLLYDCFKIMEHEYITLTPRDRSFIISLVSPREIEIKIVRSLHKILPAELVYTYSIPEAVQVPLLSHLMHANLHADIRAMFSVKFQVALCRQMAQYTLRHFRPETPFVLNDFKVRQCVLRTYRELRNVAADSKYFN